MIEKSVLNDVTKEAVILLPNHLLETNPHNNFVNEVNELDNRLWSNNQTLYALLCRPAGHSGAHIISESFKHFSDSTQQLYTLKVHPIGLWEIILSG
jgi:hypothetical protein